MRILGWRVDGFGVLRDHEVRDLPEGMTVFLGPNEAGKSTLLSFLRGALFGFPDGRSKEPAYPPVHGGRHGGRVFLRGQDGDYVLERYAGRGGGLHFSLPDGREGGDDDLRRLLGGADAKLFNSVFAFSLSELSSFESLTEQGVRDRIFSAGITGAGQDARQAMDRLESRMSGLLKSGRGAARLNDLVRELGATRKRLKEAREQARGFDALLERERQCRLKVEELSRRDGELEVEQARLSKLRDLWPVWSELAQARRDLDILPAIDSFPSDAAARLAGLLREGDAARRQADDAARRAAEAGRRSAALWTDDAVAGAGEIEDLAQTAAQFRGWIDEAVSLRAEAEQARRSSAEKLRDLGPAWDDVKVEGLDASVARGEEIRAWDRRLHAAAQAAQTAAAKAEQAAQAAGAAEGQRAAAASRVPAAEPPALAWIDEQEAAARRLRANWAELRALETEADSRDAVARDRERGLRALDAAPAWAPPKAAAPAAWGAAAVALAAAIWRLAAGAEALGAGLVVVAALACAAAIGAAVSRRRQQQEDAARQALQSAARQDLDAARAQVVAARQKAGAVRDAVARDAAALGLPLCPSSQEIENHLTALARQREARAVFDAAAARLADAANAARDALQARARATEEAAAPARALETAQAEWRRWLAQAKLAPNLDPQAALAFLDAARAARDAAAARRKTEGLLAAAESRVAGWEARARSVLAAVGEPDANALAGQALASSVRAWGDKRRQEAENRRAKAKLDDDEARWRGEAEAALHEAARLEDQLHALLAEAGAEDEKSFRERLAAWTRRQELAARAQDRQTRIDAACGAGEAAEKLRQQLAGGDVDAWERRLAEIGRETESLRAERDAALREHRDAERAVKDLAESAAVASLEAEEKTLAADIAEAAAAWRVAAVARALIERTLAEFERGRQPEVLAQASAWFRRVTGGRYERALQGREAGGVAVVDRQGGRLGAGQLSRGTAEQLYLCVRLGLAAEFARRSQPLPLIMDDVLVNFDPVRAGGMAKALAEFSAQRQVLLFTCHPSTRDALRDANPAVNVVEMAAPHLEQPGGGDRRGAPARDREQEEG